MWSFYCLKCDHFIVSNVIILLFQMWSFYCFKCDHFIVLNVIILLFQMWSFYYFKCDHGISFIVSMAYILLFLRHIFYCLYGIFFYNFVLLVSKICPRCIENDLVTFLVNLSQHLSRRGTPLAEGGGLNICMRNGRHQTDSRDIFDWLIHL